MGGVGVERPYKSDELCGVCSSETFGYSTEKATQLMLDVHEKGRAVVSNGTREKAELDVFRLHEYGLWATMQKDL